MSRKWHSFAKPRKSTRELYKQMQRLEQKEKDETERELIQKRIYEMQHKRRIAVTNKLKSFGSKAGSAAKSGASSLGKSAAPVGQSAWKKFVAYEKKKHKNMRF